MRKRIPKILVTGGCGFIGSAFVRLLLNRDCPLQSYSEVFKRGLSIKYKVIVVDKLTYAGDLERLKEVRGKYKFYQVDICDKKRIDYIFSKERPRILVNFAAETHVDRSIKDASAFTRTNIEGVRVLLEVCRKYKIKKFIQISTDEVYGEIKKGKFTEQSPLRPNSPYAASKAAADLLIRSYIRTYVFPALIVRPCNNYGPWQYPEKFIPVVIYNALQGRKVPVYAKGFNKREWLYVSDCASAILLVLKKAKAGEVYNIGSNHEKENIGIAKKILNIMHKPTALIKFVKDRPGHDWRYRLDSCKVRQLGWEPAVGFKEGIKKTVTWNEKNFGWLTAKI